MWAAKLMPGTRGAGRACRVGLVDRSPTARPSHPSISWTALRP